MEGVHPLLVKCATDALSISKYDMTIPWMGGVRTAEEQNEIFQRGASKMDGYKKLSYHQPEASPGPEGCALDIDHYGYDWNLDDVVKNKIPMPRVYRHFAACMFHSWQNILITLFDETLDHAFRLEWGGHWQTFVDVPHWQLVRR